MPTGKNPKAIEANRTGNTAIAAGRHFEAEAADALRRLSEKLRASTGNGSEDAHRRMTRDDIERFLNRPGEPWKPLLPPAIPPGPPI